MSRQCTIDLAPATEDYQPSATRILPNRHRQSSEISRKNRLRKKTSEKICEKGLEWLYSADRSVYIRRIATTRQRKTQTGNETMKTKKLVVKIERKLALVQPYPRSGNFTTQTPSYDWWVSLNGRLVEDFRTLRAAKEAAASYGEPKPQVIR
jgi:hypothetical protein